MLAIVPEMGMWYSFAVSQMIRKSFNYMCALKLGLR